MPSSYRLVKVWLNRGQYMVYDGFNTLNGIPMTTNRTALFENVHQTDPLNFWSSKGTDYHRVTEFLDLGKNELSKIGGISERSVRLDKRIPRNLKDRLDQIANICALVAEYFNGDPERTVLWFKSPNPLLGGISPRDMIRFGRYKKLMAFIVEARQANQSRAA